MTLIWLAGIPWSICAVRLPFLLRPILKPITAGIASKLESAFVNPEFTTHFGFLERQLASAPDGGPYLCSAFTGADILMSFLLLMSQVPQGGGRPLLNQNEFRKL
ncbi:hypothetical protein C8R43DRAFT_1140987 [Mycena crocata]|nr:hypothetical protein C8R43DRAFT_1140987 [Mycena crocata]